MKMQRRKIKEGILGYRGKVAVCPLVYPFDEIRVFGYDLA
jgi:hypothetical protein